MDTKCRVLLLTCSVDERINENTHNESYVLSVKKYAAIIAWYKVFGRNVTPYREPYMKICVHFCQLNKATLKPHPFLFQNKIQQGLGEAMK